MIEIAAAVCMISAPERCRDISLEFEAESANAAMCMTQGQIQLAEWTQSHPNWRIVRFSCRPAGSVAKL